MEILTLLKLFVLLPVLITAQSCTYRGKTYSHNDVVDSCAKIECHKGSIVTIYQTSEVGPTPSRSAKDIIVVLDNSGSIGPENFVVLKKFLSRLTQHFDVGLDPSNGFLFGVVSFSNEAVKVFDLDTYITNDGVSSALQNIAYEGGLTYTDKALNYIADNNLFARGRPIAEDNVLLITDGNSNEPKRTQEAAKRLRQSNVKFITVGIGQANEDELRGITGDSKSVYYVKNFIDLERIVDAISSTIISGGQENVKPVEPVTVISTTPRDVIILLDNSVSIDADDFVKVKKFVSGIVQRFNVGTDVNKAESLFGVISFSDNAVNEFNLNAYPTKSDLTSALTAINYGGKLINTDKALNYIVDNNVFDKGRPGVGKIVVLVTDNISNQPQRTVEAARKVGDKGIPIVAVGVGGANVDELNSLTGNPDNVYYVNDFEDLPGIEVKVATTVNRGGNKIDVKPAPLIPRGARDVIFVLDNSGSIGADNFTVQKQFTADLTRYFDIGPDATRSQYLFGAVTFATNVVKEFDLNKYTTNNDLASGLLNIKYTGGWTYADKAFNYVVDNNLFHKGRSSASDVIIFVTDGKSNFPDNTLVAAKRLRNNNIKIIAVGVGEANVKELTDITGNPRNVFYVNDFNYLKSIKDKILSIVNEGPDVSLEVTPAPVCKAVPKDIIFVLDNSGSIGSGNFVVQKKFTAGFVQRFNVGPDVSKSEYAFGAISFATDVVKEFDLNTFKNKEDVSSALWGVRYTGGWTYTDKAFNYIVDNNSFGKGRSGAVDVAILVTDGKSNNRDRICEQQNHIMKIIVSLLLFTVVLVLVSGAAYRKRPCTATDGKVYQDGTTQVPKAIDDCNFCTCNDGEFQICTLILCLEATTTTTTARPTTTTTARPTTTTARPTTTTTKVY